MTKLFVWDFHGTLEKGTEVGAVSALNLAATQCGVQPLAKLEDVDKYFGNKIDVIIRKVFPNISEQDYKNLEKAFIQVANGTPSLFIESLAPNDHAHWVLSQINSQGHDQILISASRDLDLNFFLNHTGIVRYFASDKIFATDSFANKSSVLTKEDTLRAYLECKDVNVIVIGDTPRDVSLKKVAGGVSYLYAHPGRSFPDVEADYKINDLREVLREL